MYLHGGHIRVTGHVIVQYQLEHCHKLSKLYLELRMLKMFERSKGNKTFVIRSFMESLLIPFSSGVFNCQLCVGDHVLHGRL
jgi:hypothetical protein